MREIKYQGKAFNGELVIGDVVTVTNARMEVVKMFIHNRLSDVRITEDGLVHGVNLVQIDPKTVREYIGLKDKNGTEIYKGVDIKDNNGIGTVEFIDGAYRVNYKNGTYKWFIDYLDSELKTLVVITNNDDNKDLLD